MPSQKPPDNLLDDYMHVDLQKQNKWVGRFHDDVSQ